MILFPARGYKTRKPGGQIVQTSENFEFPSLCGRDGLMWKVGLWSMLRLCFWQMYPEIDIIDLTIE